MSTRKPGDLPSNVAQPEDGVFHWCGLPFEATTNLVASPWLAFFVQPVVPVT
jgi:hypothetical protein